MKKKRRRKTTSWTCAPERPSSPLRRLDGQADRQTAAVKQKHENDVVDWVILTLREKLCSNHTELTGVFASNSRRVGGHFGFVVHLCVGNPQLYSWLPAGLDQAARKILEGVWCWGGGLLVRGWWGFNIGLMGLTSEWLLNGALQEFVCVVSLCNRAQRNWLAQAHSLIVTSKRMTHTRHHRLAGQPGVQVALLNTEVIDIIALSFKNKKQRWW